MTWRPTKNSAEPAAVAGGAEVANGELRAERYSAHSRDQRPQDKRPLHRLLAPVLLLIDVRTPLKLRIALQKNVSTISITR